MNEPIILKKYRDALQKMAKGKALELAHGQAEAYWEYQNSCGVIKGLDEAIVLLDEILEEYIKDDQ